MAHRNVESLDGTDLVEFRHWAANRDDDDALYDLPDYLQEMVCDEETVEAIQRRIDTIVREMVRNHEADMVRRDALWCKMADGIVPDGLTPDEKRLAEELRVDVDRVGAERAQRYRSPRRRNCVGCLGTGEKMFGACDACTNDDGGPRYQGVD